MRRVGPGRLKFLDGDSCLHKTLTDPAGFFFSSVCDIIIKKNK